VTHREAVELLLGGGPEPASGRRAAAEAHVADCSDCWRVLAAAHEALAGEPPPEGDRMDALFGCAAVRDRLYLVLGLGPDEAARRHPAVARHLTWCHACAGRVRELAAVEHAVEAGEFGPPLSAPAAAVWRDLRPAGRGKIREATGRVVVRVRRAAATFAVLPAGFIPAPALVPAGALRGASSEEAATGPEVRQVTVPLADSGRSAELRLEPEGAGRVRLTVGVSGAGDAAFALRLHAVTEEGTGLLARQTLPAGARAALNGLVAGEYLLDLRSRRGEDHFRLRLQIEPGE
jgi:hypothetical protein